MTATLGRPADLTPTIREVDAAVRAALADVLRSRPSPPKFSAAAADTFTGRLLSLRHAEALPEGARSVRVEPGTVVTPLARDFLKKRGVEVRVVSRSALDRLRDLGEWGFWLDAVSGKVEAVRRVLLDGEASWEEIGPGLEDVTAWVIQGDGRGVLALTDDSAGTVYRASRVPGVRPAFVAEPASVARAVGSIGVNVLVVEPAGLSIPQVRQFAAEFRRRGAPRVPEGWEP